MKSILFFLAALILTVASIDIIAQTDIIFGFIVGGAIFMLAVTCLRYANDSRSVSANT